MKPHNSSFDRQLAPVCLSHTASFRLRKLMLAGVILAASEGAYALSTDLGEAGTLRLDNTLRYSSSWRVEDQDDELLADANGDDGNRNFDDGQIQSRFDLLSEMDLNFGDYGVFVRGRAYYDDVYARAENDHDSPATSNNLSESHDRFTDDTRELIGKNAELLDAFAYGNFDFGDTYLTLRTGRQVINWGESLFLQGGVSTAQVPLDATRANSPGVELKEIFLPVGQVFGQVNLTSAMSLSGYYQYEWEETRLNPAGSYFSTQDFLDEGGESFILAPGFSARRSGDQDASDSGQYGVALRYVAEPLNYTEFGLYHLNYHDKLPQLQFADFVMPAPGVVLPTTYHLEYEEDIKLYGASFNTVVGGATIAGEVSYRDGQPVRVVASLPAYERANTIQTQVSTIMVLGPNPLMDSLSFAGEVGVNRVNGYESSELHSDRSAWGVTARLTPEYYGIYPGLDMKLPLTVSHGANGVSSIPGTFTEGVTNASITAEFSYLDNYQATLGYTGYFGSAEDNKQKDRDFVSMSLSYTF
ncbi:DUF1302 domain-containing protein [Marinobacter sp. NP-4(2019)]|uniref:DUF1302 domain-containing protein n=1 Tax=Marinobacter sp. NP-4(2019) TaxID=2488665 RepID=UPI000FC3F33A|nr:DUF1302 domain-containing protein [Marinobacter sp. NP-4(2019)]AZT85486.1 DUF1302 domain-containing protein [Marinobacter sp. NP-4(2019)]